MQAGDKLYISPEKLLPLQRFLPQPKGAGGGGGKGKGKDVPEGVCSWCGNDYRDMPAEAAEFFPNGPLGRCSDCI